MRVSVLIGGNKSVGFCWSNAVVRSFALAMIKSFVVAVGSGVLCGSHVTLSVIRIELVSGI